MEMTKNKRSNGRGTKSLFISLAEKETDIVLDLVRLMDRGVCALFTAKPGPVTLLDLTVTTTGYQCAVLEGEALSTNRPHSSGAALVRD